MSSYRWAIAFLLFAFLSACDSADTDTQIIVAVDSNLTVGDELDRLDIRVFDRDRYQDGEELRMTSIALAPVRTDEARTLPLTFLLEPEQSDSDRAFRLVITGQGPTSDGTRGPVVEAQVVAAFEPGKARRLDVYLSRTCLQTLCRQGPRRADSTCARSSGSCAEVQQRTELSRATEGTSAGYTPICDVPPLCVDGSLRTCSADGVREEYHRCAGDGDPCHVAACPDGGTACVFMRAPDAPASCDAGACGHAGEPCCAGDRCGDADPCNGDETCVAGVCQAGTPLSCSDGQTCTDDRCTPMVGCAHMALPDETPCDDADACTRDDRCQAGVCVAGPPLACVMPTPICAGGTCTPAPAETCNGVDDDQDGSVDEDTTRACYMGPAPSRGVGACRDGSQACIAGTYGACVGEVTPANEVCNGLDDDCDGEIDEPVSVACFETSNGEPLTGTPGTGTCTTGTRTCMNGVLGPCIGAVGATAEVCGDDRDEDCDGTACSLHAVTVHARNVDDYAYVRSEQNGTAVCEGAGFDCDLRAFVLAQPDRSDAALRAHTFSIKLSNPGCGPTEGSFYLEIDGVRQDLPSQRRVPRAHCGITHRLRFVVDFVAGTMRVEQEDRCPFVWSCTE